MGDYDIMTSQMPQKVGSTQDQGLGLAKISRVKGYGQKWQDTGLRVTPRPREKGLDLLLTKLMNRRRHLYYAVQM